MAQATAVVAPMLNKQVKQVLTNPMQVEILNSLRYQKLSIDELADLLQLRHGQALQHISTLRQAGLVTAQTHGHNVYYTVTDPRVAQVCGLLYHLWADELAGKISVGHQPG